MPLPWASIVHAGPLHTVAKQSWATWPTEHTSCSAGHPKQSVDRTHCMWHHEKADVAGLCTHRSGGISWVCRPPRPCKGFSVILQLHFFMCTFLPKRDLSEIRFEKTKDFQNH